MTIRKMRRARFVAATALSLALSMSPPLTTPAAAQWTVYDPANFSQNVLTAARELQQINNQIQMLTNQAQSLVNQAKNLANLPMSTLAQLQSSITQTQSLLSQAQNIAFSVQRIQTAYSSTYGAAPATDTNATRRRRESPGRTSAPREGVDAFHSGSARRAEGRASTRRRTEGRGEPNRSASARRCVSSV